MHKVHAGFTVLAPLLPDRVEAARRLLQAFHADPARLPLEDARTTHFATGAVIPAQERDGERLPATLLLATSFWGPARAHVDELVRTCGAGLRELLAHCEGFPAGPCSDEALARFLRRHRRADTFYSGMHHLTRDDVHGEHQLRAAIEDFVDDRQRAGGFTGSAIEIRRELQAFVASRADLAWALEPCAPSLMARIALHGRALVLAAALVPLVIATLALVLVPDRELGAAVAAGWLGVDVALLGALVLVRGVRDDEELQRYVAARQPDDHVRALAATQNHPVINEMTIAGPIKEGVWRPLFLRIALWIVARAAPLIDIPTVATARWIAADRGRRLIFISNFTNAAEPYVRDFIDVRLGAMRINLTFGFGRGYPPTQWVMMGGALDDPNAFIHVVHANWRATELWFCPYRDLSIDNIRLNRRIREGLSGTFTEEQARAWLRLL